MRSLISKITSVQAQWDEMMCLCPRGSWAEAAADAGPGYPGKEITSASPDPIRESIQTVFKQQGRRLPSAGHTDAPLADRYSGHRLCHASHTG